MKSTSVFLVLKLLLLLYSSECSGDGLRASDHDGSLVVSAHERSAQSSTLITFSEFPVTTIIENQYAATRGVVFGPDTAFIALDESTPSSPVLSGFPIYTGPISGRFVQPTATNVNATVQSFSLSAGFFDKVGTTRLQWFDPSGTLIGQATNLGVGIERIEAKGGNIASFRIGIVQDETQGEVNGFVIDNFTSTTVNSGILFRELRSGVKDGSWGANSLNIPGFDHVALNYQGSVYESHPGYRNGPVYVSSDGRINRTIAVISGVQNEHVLETFQHDSSRTATTAVVNFAEIPIDESVAVAMRNIIATKVRSAGFLGFTTVSAYISNLQPAAQKGRNNTFTGVGLIEWAAEQAGVNRGQGFVPNNLEFIGTTNESFPLLSPELLYYAMQNQALVTNSTQSIKGYFDPVDYVLTDPLGRKTGVVNRTRYQEIPTAFVTPKSGDIEYIVITNPIPGEYNLKVYGIPGKRGVAVVEATGRPAATIRTTGNASIEERNVAVPAVRGSRGDVNRDGTVNFVDLNLLRNRTPSFVTGFGDPADMNGDGSLDMVDVNLLSRYLNRATKAPTRAPRRLPTKAPTKQPTTISSPVSSNPSDGCSEQDACSTIGLFQRFRMHRTISILGGSSPRCIELCTFRALIALQARFKWVCGSCP